MIEAPERLIWKQTLSSLESGFASLGALSLIEYVITDAGVEDKHKEVFRQNEIELIIAE